MVVNLTDKTDYARAEICKFNPCFCMAISQTVAPPDTRGFVFIGKGLINCGSELIEDKGFNKNDQPSGSWQNGTNFQTHCRQPLSNLANSSK